MSFGQWKDKKTVVHSYNEILLSNKKEQYINISYSMEQFPMHFFKCKELDPKGYKPYDSIFDILEKTIHRNSGCQGLQGGEEVTTKGQYNRIF